MPFLPPFLSQQLAGPVRLANKGNGLTLVHTVVRRGASPKVTQELARHSTVELTLGRYAHVGPIRAISGDKLRLMTPVGHRKKTLKFPEKTLVFRGKTQVGPPGFEPGTKGL
jgi:hypothetical protein